MLRDLPSTTAFRFEFLLSPPPELSGRDWNEWSRDNAWRPVKTYLLLEPGVEAADLEARLPQFMARHMGDEVASRNAYHIQPLDRLHLYSMEDYRIAAAGDIERVRLFTGIAAVVLLIACVNFVNLATARSAHRTREVGVRKAIGARRSELAGQFLGESLLLVACAFGLALGLVQLLLPEFNSLIGAQLTLDAAQLWMLAPHFGALGLTVGLCSGAYPALYLSSFRPVEVLKGTWRAGAHSVWLRKGLVVFQFAASVLLIIGTAVVYLQVEYMTGQRLGFDKEHVVSLWVYNNNNELRRHPETAKREFLRHPGVLKATVVMGGIPEPSLTVMRPQGWAEDVEMLTISGDEDLLAVYGIQLAAGRNIERPGEYLLNEAAVTRLGWTDPVGKQMTWISEEMPEGAVVGVVKDFHFESFKEPIKPLFLSFCPFPQTLAMRLSPDNLAETMAFLKDSYDRLVGQNFWYRFLDDRVDALYREEQRVAKMLLVFGGLALVVACLGLLGLAAFAAELRTREIGIRKVLGATAARVVLLISRDFAVLVCAANVAAFPLAWYALHRWLESYAYRIDINPAWFALAGVAVLGLALATASSQTWRAARANPADSLRYE